MRGTKNGSSRARRGRREQSTGGVRTRSPLRRVRLRTVSSSNTRDARLVVSRALFEAEVRKRIKPVLAKLLEAYRCAQSLGRGVWDFAVEIDRIRATGVSNTDLRYLLCAGYAEHATEVTGPRSRLRVFRKIQSLGFTDKTCFVLTELGESFALKAGVSTPILSESSQTRNLHSGEGEAPDLAAIPKWLSDRRELRLGDLVVKTFKQPAPNQEIILAAFEEEKWPVRIDDPLPPHGEQDP